MFSFAFSHGNATKVNVKNKTTALFLNSMLHIHYRIDATADHVNGVCLDYVRALCKEGHLKDALLHIANKHVDSLQIKKSLTHAHINERGFGFVFERVLGHTLVNMYAKCGSLVDACRIFNQMPERDVCSWTVMISAYAKNGLPQEAVRVFHEMQRIGVQPNQFTFASVVLPACSSLASLEEGMQMHDEIIGRGYESDLFVGNALVDMYAKCGSIEKAHEVFEKMSQPDVVSWTTLMAGYAQAGHLDDASELFAEMPERDVWSWAGYLDEAEEFINKMPIKPHVSVWNSLLGVCRLHNNVELGEHVAERIFELDPNNATTYVLLSNIYAATDRWGDFENARKIMKDRELIKIPGCSWIEVNKEVNAFLVGDN